MLPALEQYRSPGVTLPPDDGWIKRSAADLSDQFPKYIITDDLTDVADILSGSPEFPTRVSEDTLDEVRTLLSKGLIEALVGNHINYISVPDLSDSLKSSATEMGQKYDAVVVSMDSHYLPPDTANGIYPLQTTRIYDESTGLKIGRGPRPHFLQLTTQVDQIIQSSGMKPVILTESGVVTGDSVENVIQEFQKRGIEVKGLCIGIGMIDAIKTLQQKFPTLEISALIGLDENITDWTEARDFLAFVPDSGQTVGRESKVESDRFVPLFSSRYKCGYTIPYPLGRANRWATLNDKGTAIMRVAGLRSTRVLYQEVEKVNSGKPFTFGDLLFIGKVKKYQVKTTLPWLLAGYGQVAREITAQARIVDVLDRLLENVYELPDGTEILLPESVTTHKFYPGGNTTILVTTPVDRIAYPVVAKKIMNQDSEVEQVGFVENLGYPDQLPKLYMAGGEFCGNAARSLALWLHNNVDKRDPNGKYLFEVSGTDDIIEATVHDDGNVSITIPINQSTDSVQLLDPYTYLVNLPGITHVVTSANGAHPDNRKNQAEQILASLDLLERPAAGVIFVEHDGLDEAEPIKINPHVHVKDVDSLLSESACASGSLAVALTRIINMNPGRYEFPIRQPSGTILLASVEIDDTLHTRGQISGPVEYRTKTNTVIK